MNNIEKLQKKALEIRDLYDKYTDKKGYKKWGPKERAEGFLIDVGELMELVMAKERYRKGENVDEKLAHELSDCLFSILCLAEYYNIDLEKSFLKTMEGIGEGD